MNHVICSLTEAELLMFAFSTSYGNFYVYLTDKDVPLPYSWHGTTGTVLTGLPVSPGMPLLPRNSVIGTCKGIGNAWLRCVSFQRRTQLGTEFQEDGSRKCETADKQPLLLSYGLHPFVHTFMSIYSIAYTLVWCTIRPTCQYCLNYFENNFFSHLVRQTLLMINS